MKLHLPVINAELAKLGYTAVLAKGQGHFYFSSGEAANWLAPRVKVRKINSLTLKQWIAEFHRLKEMNEKMLKTIKPA